MHSYRRFASLAVTVAAVCALLAGCQSPGAPGGGWSSKEHSVLPGDQTREEVVVAIPVTRHDAANDSAVDVLIKASQSPHAALRANAIEAMEARPDLLFAHVGRCLGDVNRGVRFVAAMAVGRAELTELALLVEPLLLDESQSVQAAAIFALSACGWEVDPSPLSTMLASEDAEIRANAAMVLGELGNPTASEMIRWSLQQPMPAVSQVRGRTVDMQLAEALIMLGEKQERQAILAALYAPPEQAELVAMACQILGRIGDASVIPNLYNIAMIETPEAAAPPEIRMLAAAAIARIDRARAPAHVADAYMSDPDPRLRAQAARTFGAWGTPDRMGQLLQLLSDPDPMVQVAAAAGILEINAWEAAVD